MLLLAAPGQGAQAPGFLGEWLELPGFADRLGALSELAGCDLIRGGTTADAEEIRDTAIAQPLLVAAAVTAAAELLGGADQADELADAALAAGVGATAGHSVGELAAEATGMTAVLGGDEQDVLAAIEAHGLTAANVNGAGQIVAAGTLDQLAAFAADPPPRARLRPLSVAGAFHTSHMAPSVDALRAAADGMAVRSPALALLSNRDGAVVRSGDDWMERIVTQVSAPVRWDRCMQAMADLGVTALIELPPAGTLTGLARRALPGVKTVALKTPGDLEQARAMLAAEHEVGQDSHTPDWRLIVAPLAGTFRAGPNGSPAGPGTTVGSGSDLGRVEMRGSNHTISPSFPATIIEWLVEDGDPVSAGQPLVRLQPEGTE